MVGSGLDTHLIGRIGRDDMGRFLINHLQTVGVGKLSTSNVRLVDASPEQTRAADER